MYVAAPVALETFLSRYIAALLEPHGRRGLPGPVRAGARTRAAASPAGRPPAAPSCSSTRPRRSHRRPRAAPRCARAVHFTDVAPAPPVAPAAAVPAASTRPQPSMPPSPAPMVSKAAPAPPVVAPPPAPPRTAPAPALSACGPSACAPAPVVPAAAPAIAAARDITELIPDLAPPMDDGQGPRSSLFDPENPFNIVDPRPRPRRRRRAPFRSRSSR